VMPEETRIAVPDKTHRTQAAKKGFMEIGKVIIGSVV